jgi:CheY-like chemotaxis protein
LGLYSLSKRMESLGGNCGVETRSDGASGSCFWIAIPYRPDESMSNSITEEKVSSKNNFNDDLEVEDYSSPKLKKMESWGASAVPVSYDMVPMNSSDETPVFAEQHRGLRILLVDDSTLIRKATSRSLCKRGYCVEVAQHGAECLKLLEASQDSSGAYGFDLVLMDLQMPVMDGLEATRRIRAMENAEENLRTTGDNNTSKSHITIIGVSAHTEGEARAECADCGMDSFIEKPLQMKHLQECILSMGITQNHC